MKKKQFFNDREADLIATGITALLGPGFAETVNRFGGIQRQKDLIRFMPVAERCKEARKEKSLSIKETASLLNVPQYRIKAIEDSRVTEIKHDVLQKNIDFLGLQKWFKRWLKNNADVYQRIQKSG
jgi:hypothetical protein